MVRSACFTLVGVAGLALGTTAQAKASAAPALANPSVRLWYEGTGRLSDNIAPPKRVTLWNTIIGEGDARENANDALFTIDLKGAGEQTVSRPLILTATGAGGKVLASRTLKDVLIGDAGNATLPLWVRDVGCAGRVVFTAQLGSVKRTVTLDFKCGE
ncbi:MAG: hypothetical protein LBV50_02660 [Novosphingobium sp.]|jgi:hypothetical protein|nr:hypothetical protein [Novosphingobium sp.]